MAPPNDPLQNPADLGSCCAPAHVSAHGSDNTASDHTAWSTHDSAPPEKAARRLATAAADAFVSIPAGAFMMGTDDPHEYPDDGEGPVHEVELSAFEVSPVCVTNDAFAEFVEATGHRTDAERFGASFVFGGFLPDDFPPTRGVEAAPWWREVEGATWRRPEGPHSSLDGRGDHPVVHVSWNDAVAWCGWADARLPTEAEWERAARGDLEGHHFPWGDELTPGGEHRMNVFQGDFPPNDTGEDGWVGTCPVATFPANGFGLYETTGNVWEWCHDWFHPAAYRNDHAGGPDAGPTTGTIRNPTGPSSGTTRVMRGGSYLCHHSYCRRYRVDARSANTPASSTGNIGFRIVRST